MNNYGFVHFLGMLSWLTGLMRLLRCSEWFNSIVLLNVVARALLGGCHCEIKMDFYGILQCFLYK